MSEVTLTREQIEAMIEYAKRDIHEGKHFSVHPEAQLALCTLALERLDMEPRPIAELTNDDLPAYIFYYPGEVWSLGAATWSEDDQRIVHSGNRSMRLDKGYTHFIALSSLPKPKGT